VFARTSESIVSYEVDVDFDCDALDAASVDFSGRLDVSRTGSSRNASLVTASEATPNLRSTLKRKQPDGVFSLFTIEFTVAAVGEGVLRGRFRAVDPFGRVTDRRFSDDEFPSRRLADARVEVTAGDGPTPRARAEP